MLIGHSAIWAEKTCQSVRDEWVWCGDKNNGVKGLRREMG